MYKLKQLVKKYETELDTLTQNCRNFTKQPCELEILQQRISDLQEVVTDLKNVINIYFEDFKKLENEVIDWAKDKGIFDKGNPIAQAEKGIEEAMELKDAVLAYENDLDWFQNSKGKEVDSWAEIEDAIGDRLVTLIISAKFYDIDILSALKGSLLVIQKRTGKMINGQFIKNND